MSTALKMHRLWMWRLVCLAAFVGVFLSRMALAADATGVSFDKGEDSLKISLGGKPIGEYVFRDAKITRPYFAHVKTPDGREVTRNYPPIAGADRMDHPEFHPGIWTTFGDISGNDYWRLKAATRHERFVEEPDASRGSFAVANKYLSTDGNEAICEETSRITFTPRGSGYFIVWDSTFESPREFTFGDQEEMGVGFRVATGLRVEKSAPDVSVAGTGAIVNADGGHNEKEVAKHASAWADYHGTLDGRPAGIALFCHPDNFRPSWFHARDYGLLVANPFGRKALGKGEPSVVVVKPGEKFRLRYGILVHGDQLSPEQLKSEFADYVKQAALSTP